MSAKVYFFKGNQYVQCDAATKTIDPGYPRSIADDWNGLKQIGFDSNLNAAEYFNNNLYFFKGKNYAIYSLESDEVVQHGVIRDYFLNIPSPFEDSPDAVQASYLPPWTKNTLFFLKGASWVYCNVNALNSWQGPGSISSGNPYCPNDLQAALSVPDPKDYYFKDDHLTTWGNGTPVPVSSVWLGLSNHGFDQGIQAAVYLATEKTHSQTPPPTPSGCGGTCGDTSSGKQCFTIPPNTEFGFTAFVNSQYKEVIQLFVDDQLIDTLTGSGLKNVYLGTKIYNSGKGKVCVSVEANGKPCKLRFVDNALSGKPGFALIGAEDSTDNDYNDSLVLLNWPLT